jgi:hypothetical protein
MPDIVDTISTMLGQIAEMQAFDRANEYDRDGIRARWAGVTVDDDAGAYIDAVALNEGPKRWIRGDACILVYRAGRLRVTLADVLPLVLDAALENPPNYYRRELLIVPDLTT